MFKNRIILALLLIILIACKSNKIQKKKIGDKTIETVFINDSIFNGLTKIFSKDNLLEAKYFYLNGKRDGAGITFYKNGLVKDSGNYFQGLKNGFFIYYDTTGNMRSDEFFFFGKRVGERRRYNNQKLSEYYFYSFDGIPLFTTTHRSDGKIITVGGEVININIIPNISKGNQMFTLTVYLLSPPRIDIKYSLGVFNEKTKEQKILEAFVKTDLPFLERELTLPMSGWKYFVKAEYADTDNDIKKVHILPMEL